MIDVKFSEVDSHQLDPDVHNYDIMVISVDSHADFQCFGSGSVKFWSESFVNSNGAYRKLYINIWLLGF